MVSNFPEVLTFNRLFLKLNRFICSWFSLFIGLYQCPGKFLGIVGQDPCDSKPIRLHVDIFRFCFHSFEGHSIDFSKMIGNSPEVSNFHRLFLKLN